MKLLHKNFSYELHIIKKLILEAHSACATQSVCVAIAFWLHHRCFENTQLTCFHVGIAAEVCCE